MAATIGLNSNLRWAEKGNNWELSINGVPVPMDTVWEVRSPFGSVQNVIVQDVHGEPVFARPEYREAPHVNCVVWGREKDSTAKFAVLRQPRPHADDPEVRGNTHPPVVFGQVVMGFLDCIIGKDLAARYESAERGAVREAQEESGVRVVLNIERPKYPWHNPNPTFVATWADLVFVEIDLDSLREIAHDRSEPIFSAEYVTAKELFSRVATGKDQEGAVYRGCTSLSVWMVFFATHPELLPG